MLSSLSVQETSGSWSRFSMHLGDFGGRCTGEGLDQAALATAVAERALGASLPVAASTASRMACTSRRLLLSCGAFTGWRHAVLILLRLPRIRSYSGFSGCGGIPSSGLSTIEFKSTSASKQTVCLDSLRLLSSSGSS